MPIHVLSHARQRVARALYGLLALVGALTVGAVLAQGAGAANHEYCFWDGSYSANAAFVNCYAQGENYLTSNTAWLVYQPVLPTIYCGANLNGSQYGSFTSGNPSCTHAYSGANPLKAIEYVNIAATTHGRIYY